MGGYEGFHASERWCRNGNGGLSGPCPCWLRCTPHRRAILRCRSAVQTPSVASTARQSESRACCEAECGGMNLTCCWMDSKGSCGWREEQGGREGRLRRAQGWDGSTALCQGCPGYRQTEEAWYSLSVLEDFLCVMLSACVSLHRCEDAPIPAAPVSSLLPFDDQRIHIYT